MVRRLVSFPLFCSVAAEWPCAASAAPSSLLPMTSTKLVRLLGHDKIFFRPSSSLMMKMHLFLTNVHNSMKTKLLHYLIAILSLMFMWHQMTFCTFLMIDWSVLYNCMKMRDHQNKYLSIYPYVKIVQGSHVFFSRLHFAECFGMNQKNSFFSYRSSI